MDHLLYYFIIILNCETNSIDCIFDYVYFWAHSLVVEQGVCNAQARVRFPVGPFFHKELCNSGTKFLDEGSYFYNMIVHRQALNVSILLTLLFLNLRR